MKIHKLNLENYYRNLMLESLKLRGSIASYTPNPEYTEVVVKSNVNDTVTIGIPSFPASRIAVRNQAGFYDYTTVRYATASIVGLTSDKSIPLGEFSLQQDANGIYWLDDPNDAQTPTLNLYTIPSTVDKLKVVISFKSGYTQMEKVGNRPKQVWHDLISNDSIEALIVNVKWEDNSGSSPVSFVDYDETGASITVDSALSDTSENPVQNKVIAGAIGDIADALDTINGEVI